MKKTIAHTDLIYLSLFTKQKKMEKDWQRVYATNQTYLVQIVQGILLEEGIKSVVINKQDAMYMFGEIEIYVQRENVLRASHLIKRSEL